MRFKTYPTVKIATMPASVLCPPPAYRMQRTSLFSPAPACFAPEFFPLVAAVIDHFPELVLCYSGASNRERTHLDRMGPLFVVEHKRQLSAGAQHESSTWDEDISGERSSFYRRGRGMREKLRWRIFQRLACVCESLVMHILMKDRQTNKVGNFIAYLALGEQR